MIVDSQSTPHTAEDLLARPNGDMLELVGGQIVEKAMGGKSSYIGGRVFMLLAAFCESQKLGWIFPADAGYQCFSDDPNKVRKPDVSYIKWERMPDAQLPDGHLRVAPDLAVEVVSHNDLYEEVSAKVVDYLGAGVRLIWVVDPQSRQVYVYRAIGEGSILSESQELSGEAVFPGFRCPVTEIFAAPGGTP